MYKVTFHHLSNKTYFTKIYLLSLKKMHFVQLQFTADKVQESPDAFNLKYSLHRKSYLTCSEGSSVIWHLWLVAFWSSGVGIVFRFHSSQYNVSFKEWVGGILGRSEHDYLDKEGPFTSHHKPPTKSTQLMKIVFGWLSLKALIYLFIWYFRNLLLTQKNCCVIHLSRHRLFSNIEIFPHIKCTLHHG